MLSPIRALHTTISASTHYAPTNNLFKTVSVSKPQMVRTCKPHTQQNSPSTIYLKRYARCISLARCEINACYP